MKHGFTLIEIMVAVSIIMMVSVGGVATYRELNTRQSLVVAGQTLRDAIRSAQQRAKAGELPPGCDRLQAYSVKTAGTTSVQVTIAAECNSGSFPRDQITLPPGVSLSQPLNIQLRVLNRGVTQSGTVTLNASGHYFSFQVGPGGSVTDGALDSPETVNITQPQSVATGSATQQPSPSPTAGQQQTQPSPTPGAGQ